MKFLIKMKKNKKGIENLINELEEQKTSYQVYKDQVELKIKEKKEKIDEISNRNEEKHKKDRKSN